MSIAPPIVIGKSHDQLLCDATVPHIGGEEATGGRLHDWRFGTPCHRVLLKGGP